MDSVQREMFGRVLKSAAACSVLLVFVGYCASSFFF